MSESLVAQAIAALKDNHFTEARDCIEAYRETNTLELRHFMILGLAELSLSEWDAAAATFADATEAYPDQPHLWFNRGLAEENLGAMEDAAESYRQSLKLNPAQGIAYGNLSNIYRQLGDFAEAENMARLALAENAPRAGALNALGLALQKQGRFVDAARAFDEARGLEPKNPLVLANLANLAVDQLDFATAWPLFAEARKCADLAVIRRDEGMARLLAGDFADGWKYYEARLELPGTLRVQPSCPRWQGEKPGGKKILLVAEQGFGDTIMFCRYANLLVQAGAEITWAVQKPLQRLLAENLPETVLAEGDPLPETDFYAPLLSLPFALGKYVPSHAPAAPYLRAGAAPKLPPADGKRKIGLVWSGSPTHARAHERSVALEAFAPLWGLADARFYAPFIGAGLGQIAGTPVIALDHLIKDFADTAALLAQLDCLVTVDTAAAHLAGALGVKTYLLLPHCPDWRWGVTSFAPYKHDLAKNGAEEVTPGGVGGETTPWYPGMTLLRQEKYGDWASVIRRLMQKLA